MNATELPTNDRCILETIAGMGELFPAAAPASTRPGVASDVPPPHYCPPTRTERPDSLVQRYLGEKPGSVAALSILAELLPGVEPPRPIIDAGEPIDMDDAESIDADDMPPDEDEELERRPDDPSPQEIESWCRKFRGEWSAAEREIRAGKLPKRSKRPIRTRRMLNDQQTGRLLVAELAGK